MKFKLVEIEKNQIIDYNGDLFDLTVEKDHSYNINGIIVHNSMCTTRLVAGCGYPQLSAIREVREVVNEVGNKDIKIIADGGVKNSGSIVKAIAAGADFVMLGGMLAGTKQTPGKVLSIGSDHKEKVKVFEGMACYSEDTEILTENGFKFFKDLNKKDKLACLNNNNEMEFNIPLNQYEFNHRGSMVNFKTKAVDILVTPNHNMYTAKRSRVKDGYPLKYSLVRADECLNNNIIIKKDVIWDGEFQEKFRIPDSPAFHKNEGFEMEIHDWLDFLGFWIAEGSGTKSNMHNNVNHFRYCVSISNNDKSIIKHYKSLFLKYSINSNIKNRGKNFELEIYNKPLCDYLQQYGYSNEKFIPKEFKKLNSELLSILLDSIMLGDGYFARNYIYTSSTLLRDDIYEIALKAGYCPSFHLSHPKGTKKNINGKEFTTNYDLWSIHLGSAYRNTYVSKEKISLVENYNGKVYCVEVPNHIVFIRRNGLSAWCGNSLDAQISFHGKESKDIVPEGVANFVPYKGCVKELMSKLAKSIKHGFSYLGCKNIEEVHEYGSMECSWVRVTNSGYSEGLPHGCSK